MKMANNVQVELMYFEDATNEEEKRQFHPSLPFILSPSGNDNIINPGSSLVFHLFNVQLGKFSDSVGPEEDPQNRIWHYRLSADFTPDSSDKWSNRASFSSNQAYRLKLQVTASGFVKTERTFVLIFAEMGTVSLSESPSCRFALTKN